MAYLQSLSGIARSGVTYCGWTKPQFKITINGTDRTANVERDEFSISDRFGSNSTFTFTIRNLTPTLGHDVKVRYTALDDYLFGGTLTQAEAEILSPSQVVWHCTAIGYRWLLTHTPIRQSYKHLGINTIVGRILADFTDGDFSLGYCPFGTIVDIEFDNVPIPDALDRLSALAGGGAWWRVTPSKVVDLCASYPESPFALTDSSEVYPLIPRKDLTQVRNLVYVVGKSTTTTSAVDVGSTSIPVADVGPFDIYETGDSPPTGLLLVGTDLCGWTGRGSPSGAGSITGVTGITEAVPEGSKVSLVYSEDDPSAQTTLSTALGSPSTGIVTHWIVDDSLSHSACKQRATAEVTRFASELTEVEFYTSARHIRAGQLVTASVTTPVTLSGNYVVQDVVLTPRGRVQGNEADVIKKVSAGLFFRRFGDVIASI